MSRHETNARLRDPITMRSTTSGTSIHYHCSFGFPWVIFYSFPPYCSALLFYLNISPVPTCLVHNCETSRSLIISICCHPCLEIKFPLIPHHRFLTKHIFRPLGSTTTFEEHESPKNPLFFVVELFRGQVDVQGAGV